MKLENVTKESAVAVDQHGQERIFPGDTVLALGFIPENKLFNALQGKVREVYPIGDCIAPRSIRQAILDGFNIATQI